MGWFFRKGINFGPMRINLSKSGLGASFGLPGFRVGRSPNGRRYVLFGFYSTGLYWIKYF